MRHSPLIPRDVVQARNLLFCAVVALALLALLLLILGNWPLGVLMVILVLLVMVPFGVTTGFVAGWEARRRGEGLRH